MGAVLSFDLNAWAASTVRGGEREPGYLTGFEDGDVEGVDHPVGEHEGWWGAGRGHRNLVPMIAPCSGLSDPGAHAAAGRAGGGSGAAADAHVEASDLALQGDSGGYEVRCLLACGPMVCAITRQGLLTVNTADTRTDADISTKANADGVDANANTDSTSDAAAAGARSTGA